MCVYTHIYFIEITIHHLINVYFAHNHIHISFSSLFTFPLCIMIVLTAQKQQQQQGGVNPALVLQTSLVPPNPLICDTLCPGDLKHSVAGNEDICFHMFFDTYHQKSDVMLSKAAHGSPTAWPPLIGSDRPLTALKVRREHDKGQAQDEGARARLHTRPD